MSFGAGAAFPWWLDPAGDNLPGPAPGANIYDQVTEVSIPGRWHTRVKRATGVIEFFDTFAQSFTDAITQTNEKLNPGDIVEWSCWEPSVYGVWSNGFGMQSVRMP